MRTNGLSAFGRMGWGTHLLVYPSILTGYLLVYKPYQDKQAAAEKKAERDNLSAARTVDPDDFQPFSPVPFHNNPELRYVYAGLNMRGYINENQINTADYAWKGYHNSYDHGNKGEYKWNWTSV